MTLGGVSAAPRPALACRCGSRAARAGPCLISQNSISRLISESFLTVKGAALFLPRGNGSPSSSCSSRATGQRSKHAGDLQQHLQTMFTLLRPEDNIRLAVRLESLHPQCTRYMVVVSTNGRQDTEESVVLGMDFSPSDSSCSIGLVLPLWSDTLIHLDGDGGFSVSTDNRIHVFKPVSVQAMWSALQSLHKACEVARCHNYFPGSLFLTWVSYYQSSVSSDQAHINEWNAMQDVQSHRADSPVLFSNVPTERERTERLIKTRLREIMMQKDLENVTSKEIRTELEMHMVCNLREFKEYIDNEMIVILGQMDSPTEIFEHVYLGSEWNASNLEELQNSGIQYILNVTREIDNFFPGLFEYHNIRVYDEEATDLLAYWNDTYKFISRAKKTGAKCLVHCKMGVSRSASTVIAYAMKEYGWDLEQAFEYVKERRAVTKPNPSFMRQLEEYQGILLASKQRHNKLWRSHSDSDLSEHHEPLMKTPVAQTLGRSNPRNQGSTQASPSLHELLQTLTPASTTAAGAKDPDESGEQEVPFSNGLGDSEESLAAEDPPTLPRPWAATVVPEVQPDVAKTVSVSRPHPPASLHHLASSPRILSDIETNPLTCEQPEASSLKAEVKCGPPVPRTESIRSKTPEPSRQQDPDSASAAGLLTQVPEHHGQEFSQQVPDTDVDCAGLGHTSDDDQYHPSATLEEAGLSTSLPSDLSTDRIDFFSAREKFLGLSQEGQTRGSSEQTVQQTPQDKSPSQESKLLLSEDPVEREEDQTQVKYESFSVSVYDDVSELEPIRHSVILPPPSTSQHVSSSSEEEEELVKSTPQGAEMEKVVHGEALQTDWPKGTVRRATRQLEQKMKQDVSSSMLLSCALGCPSLRSTVSTSSRDRTEDTSSHTDLTPDPSTVSAHHHQPESTVEEKMEKEEASPIEEGMGKGGEIRLREEECGHTGISEEDASLLHLRHSHSSQSSSSPAMVLQLEGVTEKETSTDCPSEPRLVVDMRETWETLKELGAFLCQVRGRSDKRLSQPWAGKEQRKGRSVQERAKEVEARIRQAGLTPPSLIKRSASLAKLGSLELSASDLSELERSPASVSPPTVKPRPHSFTDDTSKKKRVLPRRTPSLPSSCTSYLSSAGSRTDKTLEDHRTEEGEHSDRDEAPTPLPSSSQCWRREMVQDPSYGPAPAPAIIPVAIRQQYGRTHPLRRLKKRTLNFPYHTM
ncbi:protein phosphatase Slingshot homolog 2b isoform X1 [Pygocentrus nattereri]|uniref:protein phosphatase Slingshot homolog 2b isoform X1 n=1 Tax=Pygocentrus nattereri TaxID=42514 RepID=UPI000814AE7C|nr:protein phosphatase Slingshot homolog 2b isoform X1 [Pygocentrus nattereri]